MTSLIWILLALVLGLLVLGGVLFIAPYNSFVRQRNAIHDRHAYVGKQKIERADDLSSKIVDVVQKPFALPEIRKAVAMALAVQTSCAA